MSNRARVAGKFAAALAIPALYCVLAPTSTHGIDAACLDIYQDILPLDAGTASTERDGDTIRVHYWHSAGEGMVICDGNRCPSPDLIKVG